MEFKGAVIKVLFVVSEVLLLCNGQGSFPKLINAGQNKPIVTIPAMGTCGYLDGGTQVRSGFCRSSINAYSVTTCQQGVCSQTCPHRTTTPSSASLLSSPGTCVTIDTSTVRPGSSSGSTAFYFRNSPLCFVTPSTTPVIGQNGAFTLTVWLRLDTSTAGTIIEKKSTSGIVFAVMVSQTQVDFDYRTADGVKTLSFQGGLSLNSWHNLAIQVYDTKISLFINGLEPDGTPYDTQTLLGPIVDDASASVKIGQRINGATQYIGRMQEFQFYSFALTNREIHQIATGVWQKVHVQTDCRCPDSHPRVNPFDSRFCIRNGEPDTTDDTEWRVNEFAHPLTFANDGDLGSYWISAFTDSITIDIDLYNGQYQVFYVVLQFYSPQPTALNIQRKKTDGLAWEDWQYFAQDCQTQYGLPNDGPLQTSTSVNCLQFKGDVNNQIPYSKGNITFQLLAPEPVGRPGYNDFYNTPELLEFVKATQIRLHMQGHYYVTHQRHNYYGIEEVTISARCNCHGHASACDMTANPYQCECLPESFTEGSMCERCLPLYNNKPFRYGDQINAYNCKRCECYGHATRCTYIQSVDQFPNDHNLGGGGVCDNCQHNTAGNQCDQCRTGYYREVGKALDAVDVCSLCNCNPAGAVVSGDCEKVGGQCSCKTYVTGRQCDTCAVGYYNLQASNPDGCEVCNCNPAGSVGIGSSCDQGTGDCVCKTNVIGIGCDQCNYGYKNLDADNPLGCDPCNCDPFGSTSPYCDPVSGQCQCQPTTMGLLCNMCQDNYYGLDSTGCKPCQCDPSGALPGTTCNKITGQCVCKANLQGRQCNECKDGFYNLQAANPDGCSPCGCNTDGTLAGSSVCDKLSGQCQCKSLVSGRTCNQCQGNSWGLSATNPDGCQACNCEPSGTLYGDQFVPSELGCDQNSGQCTCLTGRTGRRCDSCNVGYYLPSAGTSGCMLCDCHPMGTLFGTTCNPVSGQCQCRGNNAGVTGRQCSACVNGYYNFNDASGMCTHCNCNTAGSVDISCDANTGICQCKLYVMGDKCDTCIPGSSNLDINNPYGCTKTPSQQPPPTWEALSSTSIKLTWEPPDEPNGAILWYGVYRDSVLIFQGIPSDNALVTQEYTDRNLQPYTQYTYFIMVANSAGTAVSPTVTALTQDSIPTGFDVLVSGNIGPRSAVFSWSKPQEVNSPITQYQLTSVSLSQPDPPVIHYTGLNTFMQVVNLVPFTNYTFTLTVCTASGCGNSAPVVVITPEAPPQLQSPPSAIPLSSSEIFLSWQPPLLPNGIITHYEVFMRGLPDSQGIRDPPETRIFFPAGWYNPRPTVTPLEDPILPPATNYTVSNLDPYTTYEFKVTSRNGAGTTESSWSSARTLEAAPLSMPTPVVYPVSSSALNVTWQEPSSEQSRGEITAYNVYLITVSEDPFAPPQVAQLLYEASGVEFYYVADGFEAFSEHEFYIEACNSIACVSSPTAKGVTLPDAPGNQAAPAVEGYNSTVMYISWTPPLELNGPSPSYQLHRTMASFSIPPPRVTTGRRFPGGGYYLFPSDTIPSSSYTGIELEFKTRRSSIGQTPLDALLLFAVSDGQQEEYIVIQIRDGRPWFLFDPQGGAVAITPFNDNGKLYDDGEWHHIRVLRTGNYGTITVDRLYTGTGMSPTSSQVIGQTTGVYVGGLPDDFTLVRSDVGNTEVIRQGFVGCVRNVRIKKQHTPTEVWEDLDWDAAVSSSHVFPTMEGCPTELQSGIQFLGRGYAVLPAGLFTGGSSFSIMFDFRTELNSGTMFVGTGTAGSFMLVELVNGNIRWQIYSGSGIPSMVTLQVAGGILCNGQWVTITLSKTTSQMSINMMNGPSQVASVNTGALQILSELYVGGLAQQSDSARILDNAAVTVQPGFGGCMKNLRINSGTAVDFLDQTTDIVNVNLDGCPPTVTSSSTCMSPEISTVYEGMDLSLYDMGLQVYTEYIYRVVSSNNQGSATSEWSAGRTKEGAPTGMSAPTDPQSVSGFVIQVNWQQPSGNSGVITQYVLTAYNLDDPSVPPVTSTFTDTSSTEYTGNITGVVPYTNYGVTVMACTDGGCMESSGVNIQTSQEAPMDVQAPIAVARLPTSLTLGWSEPGQPNGIITGYALYMENGLIYSGNEMAFAVTGLSVYTSYQFRVTACTQVGCTDSDAVSISTSQLPPSSIDPPTLFVEGARTIGVTWTGPSQMNGVLESYLIYVSTDSSQFGEVMYNSTAIVITQYTLQDLVPGTTYYVRISACTSGGCVTSSASTATTVEDTPEGVPAPTVIPLSPFSLSVTWSTPETPNGVITGYSLYQNGVIVQTGMSTSYAATGLTPWSLHTFRVEACTNRGCTVGPATEARTEEAPPNGAISVSVNIIDAERVSAVWSSPSQPNGFIIYEVLFTGLFYVSPETGNYGTVTETRVLYNGTDANTQVIITGMLPYTNYNVQVRAYNTKGSLLSVVQSINMPASGPDGVFPPALTPLSPTSIQVTWQAPARNNAPGQPVYQVVYRPADRPDLEQSLFNNPVSSTSYTVTGLTPYTEYQFRLIVSNTEGYTQSDWNSVYTLEEKPGPVDPPMGQVLGPYSILVVWEEVAEPNGVIVQVNLYQNDVLRINLLGNTTSYLADELLPNRGYFFRIEVCNSFGCSESSNSPTYTTQPTAPGGLSPPTLLSETPTSILITWSPPQYPNGVLQSYEVERRLLGTNTLTTVTIVPASAQRLFVDQSAAITPYTTYEYRVTAKSSAGSTASDWAHITTKQAPPGGLATPQVEVLSSTSIRVTWQPPVQPNGEIISYAIRLPNPRIFIDNTTLTEYIVEDLVPYTQYSITLQACTGGGCSESDPVAITTHADLPSGVEPPQATAITQNYISVLWSPPARPNGPDVRYELSRMKIRQPLATGPVFGIGFWEMIYSGVDTAYQDLGLSVYTTYQYSVTVYNSVGQLTSEPSREVTTLAGVPTVPGTITATAQDHTSVYLEWTTPSEQELQGSVMQYYISYSNSPGVFQHESYPPDTQNATISSLTPNSYYEFRLTIDNGAYNITSAPAFAETDDGAPSGFGAPIVYPISSTSFRVVWQPPSSPNGEILYYRVYLDGSEITTQDSSINSFIVYGLEPYTVYDVQVEICTTFGCVMSDTTKASTQEAPPVGVSPPVVQALGSDSVSVEWSSPSQPNGIITRSDIYRRTVLPCDSQPENPDPSDNSCSYIQCRITESLCGTECFSGNKVCCSGTLHDYMAGYECCDGNYIAQRGSTSDVCCGGQFYSYQADYQCCNGQYVQVMAGQICCTAAGQDSAIIGNGDACCAGIPYDSNGPQICCRGMFYDKYNSQCCGDSVVSNAMVCCEDATTGSAYAPDNSKECCGTQYVDPTVTLCCDGNNGVSKAHTYPSAADKLLSNDKCCSMEKISVSMQCCNNIGYDPSTEVCADRGTLGAQGCGTATICPIQQAATAFCDSCNFDRNNYICGSVTGYYEQITPIDQTNNNGLCATTPMVVHSADASTFRYTDNELSAYTTYEYSVLVANSIGSTQSEYSRVTTDASVPQGVQPPQWSVSPGQLDTIMLSWRPPTSPNGQLTNYVLKRDGVEIYRGLDTSYTDNSGIQPFEDYEYVLQACTYQGCAASQPVYAVTLEAPPADVFPPVLSASSAYSVVVSWQIPGQPNGVITEYQVFIKGQESPVYRADASTFTYTHSGLEAYTEYEFRISACTIVGCTASDMTSVRTLQAPPQDVQAPVIVVVSAISLEIYWREPSTPNGVVTNYRLFRNNMAIYTGSDMLFVDNVSPGSRYVYAVEATTQAGSTRSADAEVTTPTSTPMGIPAPRVTVQGPTTISAQWDPPTFPNGQITQYGLLFMSGSPDQVLKFAGVNRVLTVTDLTPYTTYDVRLQVCTSAGCGVGPKVTAQTQESSPQQQPAPALEALGPALIEVTWEPPAMPNGVITSYYVLRRMYGTTQELLVNIAGGDVYTFRDASPSLLAFTTYEYKIRAENSQGTVEGVWSQVKTLESPPSGMGPPALQAVSSYSVHAEWQSPLYPNGDITAYRIEYQSLNFDPTVTNPIVRVATVSGDVFEATFYGLAAYTSYQVRVIPVNSAGESNGIWAEVVTMESLPTGLQPFIVEQMTDGKSVLLKWNPPTSPNGVITEYKIYEMNPEGQYVSVYVGLSREYLFRRLEPFTEYSLVLEACTGVGCTRGDVQTVQTAEVAPANQPAPTLGFTNATIVELQWKPPVDANGVIVKYDVLRRSQVLQARRRREVVDAGSYSEPVVIYSEFDTDQDEFTYLDTSLQPYSSYEYKIRAINSRGFSDSDWVRVNTDQAPPSGLAPPLVEYVLNYPTRLRITWSEPQQRNGILQSYLLQRNASTPFSFDVADPKEYIDSNLQAYTTYSYTITACTAGGCTTSDPTIVKTLEGEPSDVSPPVATPVSATAIQLTWNKPPVSYGEISRYDITVDGNVRYSGLALQTTISALNPYQEYSFVLVACTSGGCTSSVPVKERTLQAQPQNMNPPVALVLSTVAIEITWGEPQRPNGVITEYELRRDGQLIYAGLATSYQDFGEGGRGLTPGREYSYVVTAYNDVGHIASPPVTASTNPSSPADVKIAELVTLSSSSITATWTLPGQPNGEITEYNLYVGGILEFSGLLFSHTVTGLLPYTEYEFRLRACTDSGCAYSESMRAFTLPDTPEEQYPPSLTPLDDATGAGVGIEVRCLPPAQPNGVILGYEIYRRHFDQASNSRGETVLVRNFTGPGLVYRDMDPSLRPSQTYEYQLVSYNVVGKAVGPWARVTMFDATPEGVLPPIASAVRANEVELTLQEPEQPNGDITRYIIYQNGTKLVETVGNNIMVQTISELDAHTYYSYHIEACTSRGCGSSDSIVVRTLEDLPSEQPPATFRSTGTTWIDIAWQSAAQSNGVITRYELHGRESCPPLSQTCVEAPFEEYYNGMDMEYNVTGLTPYTLYDWKVVVYNSAGARESTVTSVETQATLPRYVRAPVIYSNMSLIVIDWRQSFRLNGRLVEYVLEENGNRVYSGITARLERQLLLNAYEFKITARTTVGEISSPPILYDPPTSGRLTDTGTPWYQSVWFIALIILIILLLLFILIAVLLNKIGRKHPYERQRPPLPPRQSRGTYLFNACGYAPSESIMDPIPQAPSHINSHASVSHISHKHSNNVYVQQPILAPIAPSHHSSIAHLIDEKASIKYKEDDDGAWDNQIPLHENELTNIAYEADEDDDSLTQESRPYSVTKEQTMFTDTHL